MSPRRSSLPQDDATPESGTGTEDRGATPDRVALGRVAVPKASDVLVEELRRRILDGELEPGAQLPPERAIVEQTGLSRSTVREALRILEVEGLILTRPGRGGGSEVRRSDSREVTQHLDVFIRSNRIRLESQHEAREAIEPVLAAMAARRATPSQLAALDEMNARMEAKLDQLPAYLDANLEWHLLVAEASGNELLSAFMEAISRSIHAASASESFNTDEVRHTAVQAHRRITDAIRAGDAEAAARRMVRHVHGFGEARLHYPGARDEVEVGPPPLRKARATRKPSTTGRRRSTS